MAEIKSVLTQFIKDCRNNEEQTFYILMLIFRKGRWDDFMENRHFYNFVFNQLEKEADKSHTVSEISEKIDKEKFNGFEQGFKKIFGTVSENSKNN